MGYDLMLFRTKDHEIGIEEKTLFHKQYTEKDGEILIPYISREVNAKEVLYMHKAYWLGNIIEELGVETKDFIYLSRDVMKIILDRSKECVKHKGDDWYVRHHFNIKWLSSYEEMVIWEQMSYFNRVMGNLLRNEKETHYWYLKP